MEFFPKTVHKEKVQILDGIPKPVCSKSTGSNPEWKVIQLFFKVDQVPSRLKKIHINEREETGGDVYQVKACPNEAKMTKNSGFVRRKSGSIPEWNYLKINITRGWFNSRIEFREWFIQDRLPNQDVTGSYQYQGVLQPYRHLRYPHRKGTRSLQYQEKGSISEITVLPPWRNRFLEYKSLNTGSPEGAPEALSREG